MSEGLHDVSRKFFFWRSVEDIRDTMDLKKNMDLATLREIMSLKMGSTVAKQIRKHVPDARVAQMLDHFVQYVGSSPYNSPAVLCSIGHMQTDGGVWYPMGGTRAVPVALAKLADELGVETRMSTGIKRIVSDRGAVSAVETEAGEMVPLSALVSNMDSVRTYRELVGGKPAASFAKRWKREPACSGVVLYLGLDRAYDHLLHHDFVFSRDPEEEFDWIYNKGEPAPDPTCYIAATSRTEPGVAPPGGEALYVLVHTPYLRPHHDWTEMLPRYRRVILDKLARCAGMPDLESRIVVERTLTPADIHERYRVLNGAIYGLASHGKFFGAFKPGNRSRDLAGLVPGGGRGAPGAGHADGADVRLDRGRQPRQGPCVQRGAAERLSGGLAPLDRADSQAARVLARRSPWLFRVFALYLRWYVGRRFHAMRLSRSGQPRAVPGRPLIVYSNHPSWWDPAVYILLCDMLFRGRAGYGPMDQAALGRYGVLERMGVFGVAQDDPRGAAQFLRTSLAVLDRPAPCCGSPPKATSPTTACARSRCGPAWPIWRGGCPAPSSCRWRSTTRSGTRAGPKRWCGSASRWRAAGRQRRRVDRRLETALAETMDALAAESVTRNPALFTPLLRGGAGVGGVYDAWRWLRATAAGRRFDPSHEGDV